MRKHFIRQIWARSNEHIRVRRSHQTEKRTGARAPSVVSFFKAAFGLWVAWVAVKLVLCILEETAALVIAIIPWVALMGIVLVVTLALAGRMKSKQ